MEEAFDEDLAKKELAELLIYKMPFGRFKGQKMIDLPVEYLLWFKRKGFPNGKLGRFMQIILSQKGG